MDILLISLTAFALFTVTISIPLHEGQIERRYCGNNLPDTLQLICKSYPDVEEQNETKTEIARDCCNTKCTPAYLTHYCKEVDPIGYRQLLEKLIREQNNFIKKLESESVENLNEIDKTNTTKQNNLEDKAVLLKIKNSKEAVLGMETTRSNGYVHVNKNVI